MDEKTQALERLRSAMDEFVAALDSASDTQWRFKPADGGWSMADTAEHVAKSNELIQATIAKQLAPLADGVRRCRDEDIPGIFDGSAPTPDIASPTGRWPERGHLVEVLRAAPEATARSLAATQGNLRTYGAPHPLVGVLDGLQWILFLAAHTESHTRQLHQIQADTGYRAA